jgi:molybdopterin molybdotransferase
MISVSEARALTRLHALPQRIVSMPLTEAYGFVLAEDYFANNASPRFTNSAMDGVAVRSEDCTSASAAKPQTLHIVGESAAGAPFDGGVCEGEAVNISTGALLPEGADAVVPREEYEQSAQATVITKPVHEGAFVRKEGSEYDVGALLLRAGSILNASRIALAAQDGVKAMSVVARPFIAVFATGNEIRNSGTSGDNSAKVRDTNTPMLQAAVQESGGIVVHTAYCEDTFESTCSAIETGLALADVVLTTGGVSVGEHDVVKEAARALGFETIFWRVKQKPGKPLFFAVRGDKRFFGLPGNPVSALICYLEYVHPMLQAAQGREFRQRTVRARAGVDLANTHGRDEFLRVKLLYSPTTEQPDFTADFTVLPEALPLEKQDSFMLTSLTEADGFVFLESNAHIVVGSSLDVVILHQYA